MNKVFDIGKFDLDVTLRDAALDPNCRPTKRMLATASIGVEPFDCSATIKVRVARRSG